MSVSEQLKRTDWVKAVERIGIASALCLIVTAGAFTGLKWFATTMVQPMLEEQIETSREVRKQIPAQTETTKRIVVTQEQLVETQKQVLQTQAAQTQLLERINAKVK